MADIDILATAEGLDPLEKAAVLGGAAERLTDEPFFKDRVAALRLRYTEQILTSKPNEPEVREQAYRMIQALGDLCGEFISTIQRGQIAKRELNKRKQ